MISDLRLWDISLSCTDDNKITNHCPKLIFGAFSRGLNLQSIAPTKLFEPHFGKKSMYRKKHEIANKADPFLLGCCIQLKNCKSSASGKGKFKTISMTNQKLNQLMMFNWKFESFYLFVWINSSFMFLCKLIHLSFFQVRTYDDCSCFLSGETSKNSQFFNYRLDLYPPS